MNSQERDNESQPSAVDFTCCSAPFSALAPTSRPTKRIMVVTSDMPSHAYAAAKLAKILHTAGYQVTLAAPTAGPAWELCLHETADTRGRSQKEVGIRCIAAGSIDPKEKPMSERPVTDPNSWRVWWKALRKPFPLAEALHHLSRQQFDMVRPLYEEVVATHYDLVIPIHSCVQTTCDVVHAINKNRTESGDRSAHRLPVLIFSSLPYDPAMYLGECEVWWTPRSLTAFPHVSTYPASSTNARTRNKTTAGGASGWIYAVLGASITMIQRFWQLLDALLTRRAWIRSIPGALQCRQERFMLMGFSSEQAEQMAAPSTDMHRGFHGYLTQHPVLSFGGVFPFLPQDDEASDESGMSMIAKNVTVIGSFEQDPMPVTGKLLHWMDRMANISSDIVYACFGTGTELSETEVTAFLQGLLKISEDNGPAILLALRASEQVRLRSAIDAAVGLPPSLCSNSLCDEYSFLEYAGSKLRIQDRVPQAGLLLTGQVKVFISHMGMGGFVEGSRAAVPFVAYPSGCDQWYNAQRAVEAGVATLLPYQPSSATVAEHVLHVLCSQDMKLQADYIAKQLERRVSGSQLALNLVDELTATNA